MKKHLILSFCAFVFALPAVLGCFINARIDGFEYYFLYACSIAAFLILSGASYICMLIFNKQKIIKQIFLGALNVFGVLLFMFLAIAPLNYFLLGDLPKGSNYQKFNSHIWQNADYAKSNIRQFMLKDIVKNVLPGKNQTEIETILGKPDFINDNYIYYITGWERSLFNIDYERLELYFDDKNMFSRYKIGQS